MKIGSLFSGVAGLDRAVEAVTGATPAWFVEFDAAPSKVLERHYPGVPNYGDVTTVDWSQVEPVDILTAGYPCQPFSHAGKRKGTDDERHLWPYVASAIRALRPSLVVLENVSGHLSLGMGTVLGDCARLGYDARWGVVRASDAGAPHRRARVFILVRPSNTGGRQFAWPTNGLDGLPVASERALLPTPRATDGTKGGPNQRGSSGDLMLPSAVQPDNLLPTPTAQAAKHGCTPDVTANGYGSNLRDIPHLLPTPTRRDHKGRNQRDDDTCLPGAVRDDYGQYGPAITRWEQVIGEPAPPPTIQGKNGPRLNPDLPRWMMGFPPGWLDGLTPSQQLKAAGNAVCQQQAELALRILLGDA